MQLLTKNGFDILGFALEHRFQCIASNPSSYWIKAFPDSCLVYAFPDLVAAQRSFNFIFKS